MSVRPPSSGNVSSGPMGSTPKGLIRLRTGNAMHPQSAQGPSSSSSLGSQVSLPDNPYQRGGASAGGAGGAGGMINGTPVSLGGPKRTSISSANGQRRGSFGTSNAAGGGGGGGGGAGASSASSNGGQSLNNTPVGRQQQQQQFTSPVKYPDSGANTNSNIISPTNYKPSLGRTPSASPSPSHAGGGAGAYGNAYGNGNGPLSSRGVGANMLPSLNPSAQGGVGTGNNGAPVVLPSLRPMVSTSSTMAPLNATSASTPRRGPTPDSSGTSTPSSSNNGVNNPNNNNGSSSNGNSFSGSAEVSPSSASSHYVIQSSKFKRSSAKSLEGLPMALIGGGGGPGAMGTGMGSSAQVVSDMYARTNYSTGGATGGVAANQARLHQLSSTSTSSSTTSSSASGTGGYNLTFPPTPGGASTGGWSGLPSAGQQSAYFPPKPANTNVPSGHMAYEATPEEEAALTQLTNRVILMLTAQPSSPRFAFALERFLAEATGADSVRLLTITSNGTSSPYLASLTSKFAIDRLVGLSGYVASTREAVNLQWPAKDQRFNEYADGLLPLPGSNSSSVSITLAAKDIQGLLLVPMEHDVVEKPGAGQSTVRREPSAVIQLFKRADGSSNNSSISGMSNAMSLSNSLGNTQTFASTLSAAAAAATVVGADSNLRYFSPKVVRLVCQISEAVGNVFRNTRMLDHASESYRASLQTHQRFASVLKVANALMSETRLDPVVNIIVSQVPELLDADRCTLFFTDKAKQELIATKGASHGRPKSLLSWIFGASNAPELPFPEGKNEIRISMSKGLAGHVARTGESLNIPDAHADPRFNAQIDKETGYKTRNVLCVPMCDDHGHIIGVVQAINKNPSMPCFTAEDTAVLTTFAMQAAMAVRNSLLFEKTTRARQQSDALLEVTSALSGELAMERLLQIIVTKVQTLLASQRCTVFVVDRDNKELYTNAEMSGGMGPALPINHERTTMIRFPMTRGIAGSVATSLKTVNIPDAYQDLRFNQEMDKETGFRTKSILCMAIKDHRNEEAVGVIQCMNKTMGRHVIPFDENDEKLLAAFCTQASVAIEKSRLFTQTEKALNHALMEKRNLKFYLSVTRNLVSDMHLSALIEQLTMQVHHLLKADDCALYLVVPGSQEYYLAKEENDPQHRRYPFSAGIVGHVATTGQTVSISADAFRDPRFNPDVDQRKGKTTHSILCCAIKAEGPDHTSQVIGIISVRDEKDRGGFEQQEEKLLKVFCAQAAVAILNRRKLAALMDNPDAKEGDRTAADYLQRERGMKIASDDIGKFFYKMEEIDLLQPIGAGSYGEVYKAVVRGRVVAVKKLHVKSLKAEQVEAFCLEAALMCQLEHPNIVGFVGAVTEPSSLCIITEFCQRGSLADLLLNSSVQMSFQQKLRCALDAASGMLYLHSWNPVILHRDLKSDNLLVDENWRIKVGDFGLTRFMTAKKAMTQVGTPMWMAPEIILGRQYTEKADIYAFGIILWELLTRLEPYEDKEPMQIVVQVVQNNLRPTLTEEFEASPLTSLMKDCWTTKAEDRPSFEVVVDRLQQLTKRMDKLAEEGYYIDDYGLTNDDRARLKLPLRKVPPGMK